jgi:hypothetical protein
MSNTWILVADTCRARFLAADRPGLLQETTTLNDRLAPLREGDLVSGKSGRADSSIGSSQGIGNANSAREETAKTAQRIRARSPGLL